MREIDRFALFLPEVKTLLREKNFSQIKELLKELHPFDIAEGFAHFTSEEKIILFKLLSPRKATEVFEDLNPNDQSCLLDNLENEKISHVLDEMAPDERADLFKELPARVVKKLFSLMKKEKVDITQRLLAHDEGIAGSLMTTRFVSLKKEMTSRQALLKVQEGYRSVYAVAVHDLYVCDDLQRLIGVVSLQTLIIASPDISIREIMSPAQLIKINVEMDQEEVAQRFTKYDLLSAPVVDKENRLLGVITIDDIVDIIHKEASEDIYGMGKISPAGEVAEIDYGRAGIFTLVKARLIWLFILLLIGAFISGRLLQGFTHILQSAIILAAFIPMLMDSGGNAGQQSLCMIVRGLATGEVSPRDIWRIFGKEIGAGLIMGILMGLVAMGAVFILQGFNLKLAFTVGLSLSLVITLATLIGALLPLLFKRLGLDPAIAASPFITTSIDATCILVYFNIARFFLLS